MMHFFMLNMFQTIIFLPKICSRSSRYIKYIDETLDQEVIISCLDSVVLLKEGVTVTFDL